MQPDHAGLQTDPSNNAPEVVPQSQPWAGLERNSSQNRPEYYAPQSPPPASPSPLPEKFTTRQHDDQAGADQVPAGQSETDAGREHKRLCGLRRRTCLWLAGLVAVVVVIVIILGAVLGTLLGSSSKQDQSPSPSQRPHSSSPARPTSTAVSFDPNSGFAAMYPTGSTTLHVYYQDGQGRIIENQLDDGKWAVQNEDAPQNTIVATDAQSGSPLAAISWDSGGLVQRQVFYLDGNDQVMATNTTEDLAWSSPYRIPDTDPATPGSVALSACVDTQPENYGLSGIRLYYSSSTRNQIHHVGMDFLASTTNIWHSWYEFNDSDANSGVACTLADNVSHVYMRNSTTGVLEKWAWDYWAEYVDGDGAWTRAPSSLRTPDSTAIAATTDGDGTDYVFYQASSGGIVRALDVGRGLGDTGWMETAANGSQLATVYGSLGSDEGPIYL